MNRVRITNYIINQILSLTFIARHKLREQDFTRNRVLSFQILFITIVRKSAKSLQIVLNELFMDGHIEKTVTNSAFTQARRKLKHTAFIELNRDIVAMQYEDIKNLNLWNGYRLLGVDASKIILPYTPEIAEEFGARKIKTSSIEGAYCSATFECCYDVLNHLAIAGTLEKGNIYEVDLAKTILDVAAEKDILIYDRGYCSYKFAATLLKKKKHFIIRCQRGIQELAPFFSGECEDKVVTINAPKRLRKKLNVEGLPLDIRVRLVGVVLSTGEIEVLMTSVMDKTISKEEFKKLYGLRWEIETFFGVLKSRLSLENFTGITVEAIKQDFWSAIFISNYETILTFNTNKKMKEDKGLSTTKARVEKVNKAVSFNAIKHEAFNILFSPENSTEETIERLEKLFRTGVIPDREERNPPRKKSSLRRLYNFFRRKKKQVY